MSVKIITRKDRLYYHFGILLESEQVLHYASKTNNMFMGDQIVRDDNLTGFSNYKKVSILYSLDNINDDEIIGRAKHYFGRKEKYNLVSNNCITFVLWCLTGQRKYNVTDIFRYYFINICKMKLRSYSLRRMRLARNMKNLRIHKCIFSQNIQTSLIDIFNLY